MQAQKNRTLRPGHEYDGLISKASNLTELIAKNGGVPETLGLVRQVVFTTRHQTERLAEKLAVKRKGEIDLQATCRSIFDFIYQHIQYHLDEPGIEQVRQPARSWADRTRGVDCEDYSVLISSILLNLSIPHKLRISAYSGSWQHIYVIVPKDAQDVDKPKLRRRDYYTIDCVTDAFDYEVPPSKTQDHPMKINMLSGLGSLEGTDQIEHTYLSESGHLMGIDGLGQLHVHTGGLEEDLAGLGLIDSEELGSLKKRGKNAPKRARFKPFAQVGKPLRVDPRRVEGSPMVKHVADAPPADEPEIVATYETESDHTVGIDGLGGVYVYDEQQLSGEELEELGEVSEFSELGDLGDLGKAKVFKALKKATKAVGKTAKAVAKVAAPALSIVASVAPIPGGGAISKGLTAGQNAIKKAEDNKALKKAAEAAKKVKETKLVATTKKVAGKVKSQIKEVPVVGNSAKNKKAPASVKATAKPASQIKKPLSLKPKAGKPVVKHVPTRTVRKGVQPVQQYQSNAAVPQQAPVSVDTPQSAATPAPTYVTSSLVNPQQQAQQAYAPQAFTIPMQQGEDGSFSASAFTTSAPAPSPETALAPTPAPAPDAAKPFYQNPMVIGGGVAVALIGALLMGRSGNSGNQAPAAARGGISGTPARRRSSSSSRRTTGGKKGVQRFKLK